MRMKLNSIQSQSRQLRTIEWQYYYGETRNNNKKEGNQEWTEDDEDDAAKLKSEW